MSSALRVFARVAAGLWLAAATAASAQPGTPPIVGTCAVRFFGTSTLHDFEGSAPCALLAIGAPDASGRYAARAEVAIAQMQTGISARDKRMREMFEAKKHPLVVASFASIDPAAVRGRDASALPFEISLHGVTRRVTPALVSYRELAGESARLEASFELSLQQFGLEAPVVMGFVRVEDRVKVVVTAELAAKRAAPGTPAAPSAPTRAEP